MRNSLVFGRKQEVFIEQIYHFIYAVVCPNITGLYIFKSTELQRSFVTCQSLFFIVSFVCEVHSVSKLKVFYGMHSDRH